MSASQKSSFSSKVLPHLDIEYQVAFYLLVARRYIFCWLFSNLEHGSYGFHFLQDRVPPEGVSVFGFKSPCLLNGFRYLNPKFVCANPIFGFYLCYDRVPLFQGIGYPPSKGWFFRQSGLNRIFSRLNWVCLFHVFEAHPPCCAGVFPLQEKLPPDRGFSPPVS